MGEGLTTSTEWGCGVYIMGLSELGMLVKIPLVFALPSIDNASTEL